MPYKPPLAGRRISTILLTDLAGEWQPYTATLSGVTLGNGSLVTRYQQIANRITAAWMLTWGSSTTGNMPSIGLPIAPAALGGMRWSGDVTIGPGQGAWRAGWAYLGDTATAVSTYALTSAAAVTASFSTAGITMSDSGFIQGNIEYEIP
ncbi:hypothetical protein [Streptomyces sp. NPDC044948]|uniref:hypothetical protein n=1 Tax=Streptomyces sp. NPDC044948 TaxID=3157092 RepID=UPI0033C59B92